MDETIPRRDFLKGAVVGTAALAAGSAPQSAAAQATAAQTAAVPPATTPAADAEPLLTLTATEHAFVVAAVDTLIPADELSPSGSDCGVVDLHRPPAGRGLGHAARGCIAAGRSPRASRSTAISSRSTPREFFRAGIAAANAWSRKTYGKDFDRLSRSRPHRRAQGDGSRQGAVSRVSQPRRSSTRCCRSPWRASSPIRSMAAIATRRRWKMVGYPGLPATYAGKTSKPISARNTTSRRDRSRTFHKAEGDHGDTARRKSMPSCVGMGWTGSILARELTKAGLKVVGLERGANRSPREDFALPGIRDEMKYSSAPGTDAGQLNRNRDAAATAPAETALPIRRLGAFLPRRRASAAPAPLERHAPGASCRPITNCAAHLASRYGKNAIPDGDDDRRTGRSPMTSSSRYYDRFDKLCGVSGKAGNLRGQKIDGGNVFEGPRAERISQHAAGPVAWPAPIMDKAAREPRLSPVPGARRRSRAQAYTNPRRR